MFNLGNKLREHLGSGSERILISKLEMLRAGFVGRPGLPPQGAGQLLTLPDGTALPVKEPNRLILLFEASFARSEVSNDNIRAVLNLLMYMFAELERSARIKPDLAHQSRLMCPFALPELRQKQDGHRARISFCPNDRNQHIGEIMLKLQNIYQVVLGISATIVEELQTYLKYNIRENSYFSLAAGTVFDEYPVDALRELFYHLWKTNTWLKFGNHADHPKRMGYECHLPCLLATLILKYLSSRINIQPRVELAELWHLNQLKKLKPEMEKRNRYEIWHDA